MYVKYNSARDCRGGVAVPKQSVGMKRQRNPEKPDLNEVKDAPKLKKDLSYKGYVLETEEKAAQEKAWNII